MASIKSGYVVLLLSALGLLAQWGAMVANGTLLGLMATSWEDLFAGGVPMKTTWIGLWPIDYVLGLLIAFFYPLLNTTVGNPAPILLTDLLLSLTVFNFMAAVEDRRRKDTSLLRSPAVCQLAWQFCGAATIVPIYLYSYIKTPTSNKFPLPTDQAQMLPFVAIWTVFTNFPLLVSVVWFFLPLLPLAAELVHNRISSPSTYYRPSRVSNPAVVGYGIVGSASAIVHVAVGLWAWNSSEMSWTRMYWPAYSAVQPGPNLLLRGAMLSVIVLAAYTVGRDILATKSSSGTAPAGRLMVSVIAIMVVFGPGTGAA
ncbi:hypothetical protein F5B21DRAFT_518728 [Xylaria acuta]|nr:hypothetical protein F5B21DRAFT_518728 [Xylaria acuta]